MDVLKKILIGSYCLISGLFSFSQSQPCPFNINFATGDLTHWGAFTGTFNDASGSRNVFSYDSTIGAPNGTLGVSTISESGYAANAIEVFTSNSSDRFGGFSTIPNINGYQYTNSVLLGSTTVAPGSNHGLIRGVSYTITVPQGSVDSPYTITYAYTMVLENGSHTSNQQPLAKATLALEDGTIIACASPSYYLPTTGTGNALDVIAAQKQGFSLSGVPSPNTVGNGSTPYRVWTKDWTEVTFNLSPYRGQKVTLTFEADNCIPGGHFAYAYFAIRNDCNGLEISGPAQACINGTITYSIPSLADATYTWTYPSSWTKVLDSLNILQVIPGNSSGIITVHTKNSCADLKASLAVTTTLPTIAGVLSGNNAVCSDNNSSKIILTGNRGKVLKWVYSIDGTNWAINSSTDSVLIANNLQNTTTYKALVQNGANCSIDSTTSVIIDVSPKSKGGNISPTLLNICQGQNKGATLSIGGHVGSVLNWQSSLDSVVWNDFIPSNTDTFFSIKNVTVPTKFRAIIKSGVCPADTASSAQVNIYSAVFPQAALAPADVPICFGTKGFLNANIAIGTSYSWSNTNSLFDPNAGTITTNPTTISAQVAPPKSSKYILSIKNANCPNLWIDTFNVIVSPPVLVNAGHDTSVVINQPLQLEPVVSEANINSFVWTPNTGLSNPYIANPIAVLGSGIDSIRYKVRATNSSGCFGEDDILVHVYRLKPDILVPTGFTPNGDGRNDVLKPILIGISTLNYFQIYNRWGQMLFSTSEPNKGWDGNLNGTPQQSGTYLFMAQGKDYLGNDVFKKGTVVLIR